MENNENKLELESKKKLSLIDFKNKLKTAGLNDKTIELFMQGHTIFECPYCKTLNMYTIQQLKDHMIYECTNCVGVYLERKELGARRQN